MDINVFTFLLCAKDKTVTSAHPVITVELHRSWHIVKRMKMALRSAAVLCGSGSGVGSDSASFCRIRIGINSNSTFPENFQVLSKILKIMTIEGGARSWGGRDWRNLQNRRHY